MDGDGATRTDKGRNRGRRVIYTFHIKIYLCIDKKTTVTGNFAYLNIIRQSYSKARVRNVSLAFTHLHAVARLRVIKSLASNARDARMVRATVTNARCTPAADGRRWHRICLRAGIAKIKSRFMRLHA